MNLFPLCPKRLETWSSYKQFCMMRHSPSIESATNKALHPANKMKMVRHTENMTSLFIQRNVLLIEKNSSRLF
jgi:hypothetical protein